MEMLREACRRTLLQWDDTPGKDHVAKKAKFVVGIIRVEGGQRWIPDSEADEGSCQSGLAGQEEKIGSRLAGQGKHCQKGSKNRITKYLQ